ncbi:hypothetical protein NUW58_g6062 [Xylaria curta]|uniref:Uncharacterized protein n=1 Tax=Xylaria curta TaxID=42375 RepID=A0ACC1P188_9PEZI|nr:hypothetical protein NUW58_g6062 [Xylaria curta]
MAFRKMLTATMFLALGVSANCIHGNCNRAETTELSTVTTSTVSNGGFESGLAPWTVVVPDSGITYFVGAPAQAGSNSFQVRLTPSGGNTEFGVSARLISAPIAVQPNVPYKLSFWTNFDNADAGFIGVQINDVPKRTVDARDHGYGGNTFALTEVLYTPTTTSVTIKFEYLFGNHAGLDRIDSIVFAPA